MSCESSLRARSTGASKFNPSTKPNQLSSWKNELMSQTFISKGVKRLFGRGWRIGIGISNPPRIAFLVSLLGNEGNNVFKIIPLFVLCKN